MAIFKNAFFTTVFVAAICLSLLMGALQYIQHSLLEQQQASQQRLAGLLVSSLTSRSDQQSLQAQISSQLQQLPGWQAAIYDLKGKLVWQSHKGPQPVYSVQQLLETKQLSVTRIEMFADKEWLSIYSALPNANNQSANIIASFAPLGPGKQQVQNINNLLLAIAAVVGMVLWFALKLNTQRIKSEIRGYIRNNRKEITHDSLTGLLNREILLDRIEHGLAQTRRNQSRVAVMYMGLDRFDSINESFGHAFGDQVLRTLSSRLLSVSRDSDTLVRIEGDEFVLLMTDIHDQAEVEQVANRVIQIFQTPLEIGSKECKISVSMGIALNDQHSDDHDRLLLNAYTAMKELKKQGVSNSYHFYMPEMSSQSLAREEKEAELYKAMDNNEFCLYYQPKVDAVTGAIKGMEALIRWQHPQRGMISPVEFIPLLEESGLIVMVGEWVLREACRVNKSWQDEGLPPLKVSVNVASPQFKQEGFVELVKDVLDSSGLEPAYLEIELTESCLMSDDDSNIKLLDQIKQLGVSISVDDFGTGYSSLSYLKRFPIDTLKIDRSFITNVHDRKANDNAAIVTAIMALSHSLRLDVVAEGVETAQELAYLHALGCRTIQGFLFSRPVSQDEFKSLQQDTVSLLETLSSVREALSN